MKTLHGFRPRALWLCALLALPLAGCALKEPTIEENAVPSDYKAQMQETIHRLLPDPTGVRDAFISEPALRPVGNTNRYIACVRFNPKDGAGGYAGGREMMGIFHAGRMTQLLSAGREQCGAAAYQLFPELTKMCKEVVCPR